MLLSLCEEAMLQHISDWESSISAAQACSPAHAVDKKTAAVLSELRDDGNGPTALD